jgi:hypothetical protein
VTYAAFAGMKSEFSFQTPVVIETTAEEVPPSEAPEPVPPVRAQAPKPVERRGNVIPFASTLRHLAPDAPFGREIA